jgi:DHA2 family multidrug resistance protein
MSIAEIYEDHSLRPRQLTRAPEHPAPANQNANAPSAPANQNTDAVSLQTWLAVIGATLGAFLAVLNIQVVNSSLADIQGAIGAGIDDGGWISTSYLIAEIIVIPLTGWLARVFSMRT